jgi:hypothetical protein
MEYDFDARQKERDLEKARGAEEHQIACQRQRQPLTTS